MKVWLADSAATETAGASLAEELRSHEGAVIYLRGDLGAGKTTLVRGLLRALGVQGSVRSPTYTLVEPYRIGPRSVIHLDLYRITDPLELANLGLSDFPPQQNWWLVEWPERGGESLPPADLELLLKPHKGGRELEFRGRLAAVRAKVADKLLQQ